MKVRPDPKTGSVVITMTAREAIAYASQLVKCTMASGASGDSERQEPREEKVEEREL
jgi:hypothetical protein